MPGRKMAMAPNPDMIDAVKKIMLKIIPKEGMHMSRLLLLILLLPSLGLAQVNCDISMLPALPDVRFTAVEKLAQPVPHCKATGIIGPEIRFELILPENWNGKFVMGGGGGFVGSVQNSALAFGALSSGYATVGTDTGHQNQGIDASWALHNLERIVNFGHQAVHRTAVTAKSLISDYYGADIERNYFVGCSRGGGQALMEAQRYPDDFDGIVAGAPAYSWSGIAGAGIQIQQAMFPDPLSLDAAVISSAEQLMLEGMILSKCDALDGIEDGILNNPHQCNFSVAELPSCSSADTDECFTPAEKAAISQIYDGPVDTNGTPLFYGFPFGGESDGGGWASWLTGGTQSSSRNNGAQPIPNAHFGFSTGIMKYMVFHDANWDYSTYRFDNFTEDTAQMAATLNATNPDLSAFRNNGGKLLIYQGWSDSAITADATIGYYEQVLQADASAGDDVRLFMMPGVLHCAGGKGPSRVNFLDQIDQWVESGTAPQQIIASYPPQAQRTGTRPLCAYPQIAEYAGSGDEFDASNFSCVKRE